MKKCSSLKNRNPPIFCPGGLEAGLHYTGLQTTSDNLLIDTDFIGERTAALHIPGKKEYFSR